MTSASFGKNLLIPSAFGAPKGDAAAIQNSSSFFAQVATVALTAAALGWLYRAKGAALPKTDDGRNAYGIKIQFRAVGIIGGAFFTVLLVWSWLDLHRPEIVFIAMTLVFSAMGLWLGSGAVITDQAGITKRVLWYSRSFRWGDITEIRLPKKQAGGIELHAGSQKLVIDFRFNALRHLLEEIEDHTGLKATKDGS